MSTQPNVREGIAKLAKVFARSPIGIVADDCSIVITVGVSKYILGRRSYSGDISLRAEDHIFCLSPDELLLLDRAVESAIALRRQTEEQRENDLLDEAARLL